MSGLIISAGLLAGVVVLCLIVLLALTLRRMSLGRQAGAFDLALRSEGRAWTIGVARYRSNSIEWYRVFSFSPSPAQVLERDRLTIEGRHDGTVPGSTIVRCRYDGSELDLAMSESAYYGLSSWTEAAPPGQRRPI